ncbi:MAG: glutaredoxin domain-containing protein [Pseudomonadota bacterium]
MARAAHRKASPAPVKITLYRWAGQFGPFKVKIPCGECALTADIIKDTVANELAGVPVEVETLDWLSNWWKPILKGGWHAPIVMVEDKIIGQGHALNRGVLAEAVIEAFTARHAVRGTHVFGKDGCPHCVRAKERLDASGIPYTYHDVVRSPGALYQMINRVKPLIGAKTPITVPQIWMDGRYVGGADALEAVVAPVAASASAAAPAAEPAPSPEMVAA